MSARKSRRAVFAEVLLTAAPVELAQFRDGTPSLRIEFATIVELRAWLTAAGLAVPTGEPHEWTDKDGQPRRSLTAYPTWHGWKIYAAADERVDVAPLSARTCTALERLTAAVPA